jgi:hypothetical protein
MSLALPALIVVDVQRAFDEWEAAGKRRNNPDAVARIADLLTAFRTSGAYHRSSERVQNERSADLPHSS